MDSLAYELTQTISQMNVTHILKNLSTIATTRAHIIRGPGKQAKLTLRFNGTPFFDTKNNQENFFILDELL